MQNSTGQATLIYQQSGANPSEFRPSQKPSYEGSLRKRPETPAPHPKLIDLTNIRPRDPFDYKEIHDGNRNTVISVMLSYKEDGIDAIASAINPLSKKIMLGTLEESGVEAVLRQEDQDKRHRPVCRRRDPTVQQSGDRV